MFVSPMTLTILLALCFGIMAFFVSYRFTVDGFGVYRELFMRKVSGGLKDTFLYLDPKTLFVLNLAVIVFAAASGFFLLGVVGMVVAVALVAALPGFALRILRKRRSQMFIYQLPDCLSGMAASLRAGSNLAKAMDQVAVQQPQPMSQEFSVVLSEYRVGRRLEDSLAEMARRINKPEVELLNSTIAISRSVGGNLADTFDTLAETIREKARVEGKITALTAMARMQGWVVGLLPLFIGLIIYMQEPVAMSALVLEPTGWITAGVLIAMMILAAYMIRKIVNIDV